MSRSYRDDFTEHEVKAIKAQKNNVRKHKDFVTLSDEDGVICPQCKRFCTYIYLARNTQCHNCHCDITLDE